MSVLIEGIALVVRRRSVDTVGPGGAEAFLQDTLALEYPPRYACNADPFLLNLSFYDTDHVLPGVELLQRAGRIAVDCGTREFVNCAYVDQANGPATARASVEGGRIHLNTLANGAATRARHRTTPIIPNIGTSPMGHIVLLGDSIFDNGSYVGRGGTTLDELTTRLPADWKATLLAVDGSVTMQVSDQLRRLPKSATHLVISSGGNDALMQQPVLHDQVSTVGEAFFLLGSAVQQFEQEYRALLRAVIKKGLPTIVCTIYNGNFPDAQMSIVTSMALAPFNDAIIRAAWAANLPIIDLRVVCDRPEHYANEIEPSTKGSARIAEEILRTIKATQPPHKK
jgi:lysophospholipase L1-like esterase